MLVPNFRLLQLAAAVLVPGALVIAYAPHLTLAVGVIVALALFVVMIDGARSIGSLDAMRAEIPNPVRATRSVRVEIPITLEQSEPKARLLHLGLALPESITSEQDTLRVRMPTDAKRAVVTWPCMPSERGAYSLDRVYLGAASPLGLWEHRRACPAAGLLRVYPNVQQERKNLAALFLDRAPFGVQVRRHIGKGREFEQLREYVPGDSFDDIHWKATARRGEPVTRMFQVERTQEVYVAIDASRISAGIVHSTEGGTTTNIERFINAALVLGLACEKQGDLFGVIAFDSRVSRFIKARSGQGHYNACRDAIYDVESSAVNPDFAELFSFIRVSLRKRALLVVLTNLSDPLLAEEFARHVELVSKNHLVLVNAIADPQVAPVFAEQAVQTTDEVYERLGGHLEWTNLQRVKRQLHTRNVALNFVRQESLSFDIVSQYMRQKQRQLL